MPFNPQMENTIKADWLRQVFRSVDWLIPAYQSSAFCETLGRVIEISNTEDRLEILRETMAAIYSPQYLATMYLERYSKVAYMREFSKQIDECFRAFYSGYRIVAVTSMIPVLEGIIRKIATAAGRDIGQGTAGLIREFELLVDEEKGSPGRYEERLIMFELLLEFMRERFLKNTRRYDGIQNFNRHGILHGVFPDFGEELNFLRIIMLLDLLLFTITYRRLAVVSMFSPEDTQASRALAADYIKLRPIPLPEPSSRAAAVMKLFLRLASEMTKKPEEKSSS